MTKLKSILLIILLIAIISPVVVIAATEAGSDPVSLTNPLTGNQTSKDIPVLIGQVISALLGIVGSIALVMFIYGGFTWMTAAGNSEQVAKGKNIIVWAAIGLVVIFASYALVRFVIQDAILGVATP
ncbi:pilin [Candidatus Parcubacteria bacterium]|nr:pilin [Candidatus Parcubacteria bacterium]MCG2701084.1 pilin [Candidatus Parcubacteria bacterium]